MNVPTRVLIASVVVATTFLLACGGDSKKGAGKDASTPMRPPTTCDSPTAPADFSVPTTVVGGGSTAGCTEAALRAAVAGGGIVTFNCGVNPVVLTVTSEVPVTRDTVIDGGGKVTLSGGGSSRILHIKSVWNVATPLLTVQNLKFMDGFTSDVTNTKDTTQGGAAIFQDGGSLTVINCTFANNHCASTGQDVSGGAINGQGIGTLIIEGSVFSGNSGSNGGAVGTQAENVTIVNTTFSDNTASGTDGNPGNGGDGGTLSFDGADVSLTLCGDIFTGNHANAQGGALFRVAYTDEPVTIDRCSFEGNSVDMTKGLAGGLYLENVTIQMTGTTIANNSANYGGGFWIGQSAIANLVNVTIANNTANMGGGVWFANQVTGTFLNCTVVGNQGDGLFGGDSGVKLQNSIFANNPAGSLDGATNCQKQHAGGGGPDLQYPSGGGALCTSSVTVADPMLGVLQDNGGPTKTMAVASGSPAIGQGTNCPATDQRGHTRATACTLGAYEAD
jgi:hypothetical protein